MHSSIQQKLNVLAFIAHQFNHHQVHWNLGASCMLYIRGYVNDFHDIDLMISLNDVEVVKRILLDYPMTEKPANKQFKTKVFLEYTIDGIEIDIMAGFSIIADGNVYDYPLRGDEPYDTWIYQGAEIHLAKVDVWEIYYTKMKRLDKLAIIQAHKKK